MARFMDLITAGLKLVAEWFGYKKANTERANSENQIKREVAQAQVKQKDEIEKHIRKAGEGDKKSLETLRRLAGD